MRLLGQGTELYLDTHNQINSQGNIAASFPTPRPTGSAMRADGNFVYECQVTPRK